MARLPRRTRATARVICLIAALSLGLALPVGALAAPPANDDFANARIMVGALPYHDTVDTSEATTEGAETVSECSGTTEASVWYRFTPVRSGVFRVDTIGSDYDAAIDVYQGTTLAGLVRIDCNANIDSNNPDLYDARVAFRATGGVRYYIRVQGDPGGMLDLTLRSVRAPDNDQFGRARGIWSLPFDANADVINATSQLLEPRQSNSCEVMRATRWYKYTPQQTEIIWANTFVAADNDTVLAVYRGNKIANAAEIVCNDDQWVSNAVIYGSGVTFKALAGVTYRFQVGGYDAESGENRELPFHVRRVTAEVNDDLAGAINITSLPYSDPVNLRRTTVQPDEPVPTSCSDHAANTAWYRYTAPADGSLLVSVDGPSDTGPVVAIFEATGPGFGGLTAGDCGDSESFAVESGKTYYFQVSHDYGVTAPVEFELEVDVV